MTTNEPVAAGAVGLGLVQAIVALLVAFKVVITADQIAAIEGVYVALSVGVAFLVRQHVWPSSHLVAAPPAPPANPFAK